METIVKPQIKPTVRAHAITRSGRKVLVVAQGPGTSALERKRAEHNNRRWNEGKRTWLL